MALHIGPLTINNKNKSAFEESEFSKASPKIKPEYGITTHSISAQILVHKNTKEPKLLNFLS
tara:strand:+ start:455 stop:640 length:186 start_codon:yes stop_codon:yes gene_type:complete